MVYCFYLKLCLLKFCNNTQHIYSVRVRRQDFKCLYGIFKNTMLRRMTRGKHTKIF